MVKRLALLLIASAALFASSADAACDCATSKAAPWCTGTSVSYSSGIGNHAPTDTESVSFDGSHVCGQYANDDFWVVQDGDHNVTVTATSPAQAGNTHGWMANRTCTAGFCPQSFDGQNNSLYGGAPPSLPQSFDTTSGPVSFVKAISRIGNSGSSAYACDDAGNNPMRESCVAYLRAVTFVDAIPDTDTDDSTDDEMRPGTFSTGPNKLGPFRTDMFESKIALLGSLPASAIETRDELSFAEIAGRYSCAFSYADGGTIFQATVPTDCLYLGDAPTQDQLTYGSHISVTNRSAPLRFLLDDFNYAGNATHRKALLNYIQHGIDLAQAAKEGWRTLHAVKPFGGGYNSVQPGGILTGHKAATIFAAFMLDQAALTTIAQGDNFWEDDQNYYSSVDGKSYYGIQTRYQGSGFNECPAAGVTASSFDPAKVHCWYQGERIDASCFNPSGSSYQHAASNSMAYSWFWVKLFGADSYWNDPAYIDYAIEWREGGKAPGHIHYRWSNGLTSCDNTLDTAGFYYVTNFAEDIFSTYRSAVNAPAVAISSLTPASPQTSDDLTGTLSITGFSDAIADCDIAVTGANTASIDLDSPFTPFTIPSANFTADGDTGFTVTCVCNTGACSGTPEQATSLTVVRTFATPTPTVNVAVTPGDVSGSPPQDVDVCVTITGTETGLADIGLDCGPILDGVYEFTESSYDPAGGEFCFDTDAEDCIYNNTGQYQVSVLRNGSGLNPNPVISGPYTASITGAAQQITRMLFYDMTQSGCSAQASNTEVTDSLLIDRDLVGTSPNIVIETNEYPHIASFSGNASIEVDVTGPSFGPIAHNDTAIPYSLRGPESWCVQSAGTVSAVIEPSSQINFGTDGDYQIVATVYSGELSGGEPTGIAGDSKDYSFTIADLQNLAVTPAQPESDETFIVSYSESGHACTTVEAYHNGVIEGGDPVNETTRQATLGPYGAGLHTVQLVCDGVITESIVFTVTSPVTPPTVAFAKPTRIIPESGPWTLIGSDDFATDIAGRWSQATAFGSECPLSWDSGTERMLVSYNGSCSGWTGAIWEQFALSGLNGCLVFQIDEIDPGSGGDDGSWGIGWLWRAQAEPYNQLGASPEFYLVDALNSNLTTFKQGIADATVTYQRSTQGSLAATVEASPPLPTEGDYVALCADQTGQPFNFLDQSVYDLGPTPPGSPVTWPDPIAEFTACRPAGCDNTGPYMGALIWAEDPGAGGFVALDNVQLWQRNVSQ